MARKYSLSNLLELLLHEGATELHLQGESAPLILMSGKPALVDLSPITSENVVELLQSIASVEELNELHACGDTRFVYLFQNWVRVAITASMEREALSVKIKNLGR